MAEQNTVPTWGYHPTKGSKIFDLSEGESLPRGWADSPANFANAEKDEPEKSADEKPADESK